MTLLKKIGEVALKIGQIIVGFNGIIPAQYQPVATKVASDLEQLAGIIQTVEIMGQQLQLAGAQKRINWVRLRNLKSNWSRPEPILLMPSARVIMPRPGV